MQARQGFGSSEFARRGAACKIIDKLNPAGVCQFSICFPAGSPFGGSPDSVSLVVNDVSEFDFISQFDCCNWAWWVGEVATNWLLRGCISYFRQPKKKGNAVCLKEEDISRIKD